jgi:ParB-like chromosome segregation protein Spo0J
MVGNPLSHPEEQVEDLKASLRQFGQVEALVVNKRQTPPVVLGGNGRLQAMLGLGWTHAAVAFVDLPERRANALATVLNRSREGAKWDKDNLDKLMRDMDTGNDEQLDAMMAALATEVGIVEKEASGVSQPARQQGESFQVIVECDTVESQTELHERLKGEGYKCKSLQT